MRLPRSSIAAFQLALGAALVAILYLATSAHSYPVVEDLNDKVSHVLAFGALAFLGDFAFPGSRFGPVKFFSLFAYGLLIEFIQYFLPYREASLFDLLADGAGLGAYWLLHGQLKRLPWLGRRWG